MAESAWQKSLRRSTGEVPRPKRLVRPRNKLASISENVNDENDHVPIAKRNAKRQTRQRLSTRDECSEPVNEEKLAESPAKKSKDLKFLAKFPPSLKLLKPDDNVPKDLKSPIPLPPGVSNIDPEDDGNNPYGRDHHHYLEKLQTELRSCKESIIESIEDEKFRKKLVEWLLHVAHHFKCSQETFYHTVDLLDRFLSCKKVKKEHLQLVGIGCYLIATKVYYSNSVLTLR